MGPTYKISEGIGSQRTIDIDQGIFNAGRRVTQFAMLEEKAILFLKKTQLNRRVC